MEFLDRDSADPNQILLSFSYIVQVIELCMLVVQLAFACSVSKISDNRFSASDKPLEALDAVSLDMLRRVSLRA